MVTSRITCYRKGILGDAGKGLENQGKSNNLLDVDDLIWVGPSFRRASKVGSSSIDLDLRTFAEIVFVPAIPALTDGTSRASGRLKLNKF